MESWIVWLVAAFIVFDAAILWWIFTKRRMPTLGGMTFTDFQKFAKATNAMIRDHMRANYSGHPEQLPDVLPELLSKVRQRAMAQGIEMDRATLKTAVSRMISFNKLADAADVERAMQQVA